MSYHGGSTLVHLARPGGVHPVSLTSLRHALFDHQDVAIAPVARFTDLQCRWEDLSTLESELPTTSEPGWHWHRATKVVTGPTIIENKKTYLFICARDHAENDHRDELLKLYSSSGKMKRIR